MREGEGTDRRPLHSRASKIKEKLWCKSKASKHRRSRIVVKTGGHLIEGVTEK